MSGLLQRLAARALAQAPSVRPIVGWSAPPVAAGLVLADADAGAAPRAAAGVPPPLAAAPRQARSHEEPREPAISELPSPLTMPPAPAPAPEPEAADKSSPAAAARERDPAPITDRFAPLLPVTPSRRLASPASPSRGQRALVRSTQPNTPAPARLTEVHVNIGRIELTAVHDAPRPRREPARTRKPQSLEDYLERREAKRR
jgi:hypothetical protein